MATRSGQVAGALSPTEPMIRYRVLGPVQLWADDETLVPIGGDRQAALLAALLARSGQVVSSDRLVDLLWGDDPPRRPGNAVQVLVSRIRSAAGTAGFPLDDLQTQPPGYVLDAGEVTTDAAVFENAIAEASAAEPAAAVTILEGALALWRGPAFGEHADYGIARLEAMRLNEMRRSATISLGAALLDAGRPDDAIGVLEPLITNHQLDERARSWMMKALYANGRHVEALAAYQDYRSVLAEELGLEPGAELRQLEVDILRHELGDTTEAPPRSEHTLRGLTIQHLSTPAGTVAWTRIGTGDRLVVVPAWVSSLEVLASGRDPRSSILDRLVADTELVLYDRRGTGLTGGHVDDYSVEAGSAELTAVVEESGGAAALFAMSQAGPAAITLAARRPDLVPRLILFGTFASGPDTFTNTELASGMLDVVRSHWGVGSRLLAGLYRPDATDAAAEHLGRVLQDSAPREVAAGYLETVYSSDVTGLLPKVKCPVLVIHYRNDRVVPFAGAQQLTTAIPGAQLLALDGRYHLPDAGDLDTVVSAINAFLTAP